MRACMMNLKALHVLPTAERVLYDDGRWDKNGAKEWAPDALHAHGLGEGLSHFLPLLIVVVLEHCEEVVVAIWIEQLHAQYLSESTITHTKVNVLFLILDKVRFSCSTNGLAIW